MLVWIKAKGWFKFFGKFTDIFLLSLSHFWSYKQFSLSCRQLITWKSALPSCLPGTFGNTWGRCRKLLSAGSRTSCCYKSGRGEEHCWASASDRLVEFSVFRRFSSNFCRICRREVSCLSRKRRTRCCSTRGSSRWLRRREFSTPKSGNRNKQKFCLTWNEMCRRKKCGSIGFPEYAWWRTILSKFSLP